MTRKTPARMPLPADGIPRPSAPLRAGAQRSEYVALGVIASRAAPAAMLSALRSLRPQCETRLRKLKTDAGRLGPHYLLEVKLDDSADVQPQSIDLWLRIKSALMAAFPADKPDAVTPLDT